MSSEEGGGGGGIEARRHQTTNTQQETLLHAADARASLDSVFDESVNVMLGAVFRGRNLKHVRHAEEGFLSLPICHDLFVM